MARARSQSFAEAARSPSLRPTRRRGSCQRTILSRSEPPACPRKPTNIISFRTLLVAAAAIALLFAVAKTFFQPAVETNPVLVLSPAPETNSTSPAIVWHDPC